MEETGRIRRGYFVAGLGATQFAMPGALDLLRSLRDAPDDVEVVVLAATDPANPYGATLKWPAFAASAASAGQAPRSPPAAAFPAPAFVSDIGGLKPAPPAAVSKAGRGGARARVLPGAFRLRLAVAHATA